MAWNPAQSNTFSRICKSTIIFQDFLYGTDLRATGRHLPYGITQCYLPFGTSERAPPNPSHTGWYSIYMYLLLRDGRLSLPSWLDSAPAGSRTSHLSITSPTLNRCTTKTTIELYTSVVQYDTIWWQNVNVRLRVPRLVSRARKEYCNYYCAKSKSKVVKGYISGLQWRNSSCLNSSVLSLLMRYWAAMMSIYFTQHPVKTIACITNIVAKSTKYELRAVGLSLEHVLSELHKKTFINRMVFADCYWLCSTYSACYVYVFVWLFFTLLIVVTRLTWFFFHNNNNNNNNNNKALVYWAVPTV